VMQGKGAATDMDTAIGQPTSTSAAPPAAKPSATALPAAAAAAAASPPEAAPAAAGVPSVGAVVDSQPVVPSGTVETQEPQRLKGPLLTQPGSALLAFTDPLTDQERREPTRVEQQVQAPQQAAPPVRRQLTAGLDREVRPLTDIQCEILSENQAWVPDAFGPQDPPKVLDERRVNELGFQVQESQASRKAAEMELAAIKVRLAGTEQRVQLLVEQQDELSMDKTRIDEERRGLRQQADMQQQRLIIFQADLERYRSEAEGQNTLIRQLTEAQSADYESTHQERSSWRSRETDLQQRVAKLRRELEDFKRRSQVERVRATTVRDEESSQLRLRVQRLQDQATMEAARVEEAQNDQKELEIEWPQIEAREKTLQQDINRKRQNMSKAMEEARAREEELQEMLHELQESLLQDDADGTRSVISLT